MRTRLCECCDEVQSVEFDCHDCKQDTITLGEFYIVVNSVWQAAKAHEDWMLCIGCLEERLGRKLVPDDFLDCPLNHLALRWVDKESDRQLDRKGGFFRANWWPKREDYVA